MNATEEPMEAFTLVLNDTLEHLEKYQNPIELNLEEKLVIQAAENPISENSSEQAAEKPMSGNNLEQENQATEDLISGNNLKQENQTTEDLISGNNLKQENQTTEDLISGNNLEQENQATKDPNNSEQENQATEDSEQENQATEDPNNSEQENQATEDPISGNPSETESRPMSSETLSDDEMEVDINSKKNIYPVKGYLAIQYEKNPFKGGAIEFTLATMTHYYQDYCTGNWLRRLSHLVEMSNIHILYICGLYQRKIIEQYLPKHVRIGKLPKYYNIVKCNHCFKSNCSSQKMKNIFKFKENTDIVITCINK